ncbi:uncharacterized protein BDV17DRAFT_263827 [Aspergillus undulatus]|uniref:uncharacterized protein n=1 Tax=Aspergillus undulatus TaxID=1810928 RepID=UPI003CCCDE7E
MLPFASDPDSFASSLSSSRKQQGFQAIRRDTLTENPPLDEPLLAVQIGGIVGAYVIFVAIILTLLLIVGRRLRRTVQSSNYTLQVEMMKPKAPMVPSAAGSVDPSPITPTNKSHGFRSWTSLTKGPQSHRSNNGSVATIDHESVVAADRRRAQDQMEMLYAAVMAHDEARAAAGGSPVSPTDDVSLKDLSPRSPMSYQSANPFSDYAQRVPEPQSYPQPQLPQYQSQHQNQYPAPAPAAAPAPAPAANATPTSPARSTTSRLSRISNLSLFQSNRDQASASASQGSKIRSPRFSRKPQTPVGISISSPLSSPHPASGPTSPADQIPLSPRFYNPAPPPIPPNSTKPQFAASNPNAGAAANHTRNPTTTSNTSTSSRRANPPTLNLHSASPIAPSPVNGPGGSSSSLPFREAYPTLLSAPPTKTTILERPEKQLNGPRTGLPTPYSPYMPFTPLTPLTPSRIVTKKQRKQLGRENGLRALNEEDAVKGEEDMWGY